MKILILFAYLGATQVLQAGYSNLIPLGDGSGVYFRAPSGFLTTRWHLYRNGQVTPADPPNELADVSVSGDVVATETYNTRLCSFAGSSCFLRPECQATFGIHGGGINRDGEFRSTFIRLSRTGKMVWIDQSGDCSGLGTPKATPLLSGLYESTGLAQISPSFSTRLANQRSGRRLITDSGRALTLAGSELRWLDWTGAQQVRNVAGAFEAVVDRLGNNIVYVESPLGRLHWIAATDQDLGFDGSAPALSDDGGTLVFLDPAGALQIYDRASGRARKLDADTYSEFAFAGGIIWAINSAGELIRVDPAQPNETVALQPVLEIQSADTPDAPLSETCFICYGQPDPLPWISSKMVVVFRGHYLDQPGWRVRAGNTDTAVHSLGEAEAWFQVLDNFPTSKTEVDVYNPSHPLEFTMTAQLISNAAACLGTVHQDGVRAVTADAPAAPEEVVSVFMTGLQGEEPIPVGIPNPIDHLVPLVNAPPLADPGAGDILFFGLAPGLIGLEQLNLRVHRAAAFNLLFNTLNTFGCTFPPVGG